VLSDPERYGDAYFRKLAGSMAVPAIASQAAQAADPHMRDARTIVDAIRARVPVLSEGVPVRRNVWGDPVERGESVGPDFLSPIYSTRVKPDALSQEVARLRVPLTLPKRHLIVGGKKIDLDAKEYGELVQLSGRPARTYLEGYIQTPDYLALSDLDRVEFIKEAMSEFRKAGRDAIKGRYSSLGGGIAPGDRKALPPGFEPERGTRASKLKPKSLREIVPPEMIGGAPLPPGFVPAPGH